MNLIVNDYPLHCCDHEKNDLIECCNCEACDAAIASLLSSVRDSLCLPWRGFANQSSVYTAFSIISVPTFVILASGGLTYMVISGCMMILLVFFIWNLLASSFSVFFYKWMLSSFFVVYGIFEFGVVPCLRILREENVILTVLMLISCFLFSRVKTKKEFTFDHEVKNCGVCQALVPVGSTHCIWLNCCIGLHNTYSYMMGLATTITALFYGSNLTFTTMCHPKILLWKVMIANDCSDVYDNFDLMVGFVAGCYSVLLGGLGMVLFICQLFRICAQKSNNKQMLA